MLKMDIKKLESDVISKIRSSFNVSSVAQCVFELVSNSLDAKSTSIAVRLNLLTFKIQVADNGEGITKQNMELLDVRYATNKCHTLKDLETNIKTYGFRGEAISSIVEMSESVSVASRFKTSSETYSRELSRVFRSELTLAKHRASVGTTITVLGWLSAVPVRQRRVVQELELEEVRKQLERLIIINPGTSFTLRNDVTGLLILSSPEHSDIIDAFCHLHPDLTNSFTLHKVSKNKVTIQMLIHKELALTKQFQYVYVNKRTVKSTKILKHVYKAFCRKNCAKTKNSLLYNTKRYPVFVMNIKCPYSYADNLGLSSRTEVEFTCWHLVIACIDKLLRNFLGLEDKDQAPVERKIPQKFNCGVSQLAGAVQACAFKRRSDETKSSDDDSNSKSVSTSKVRRLDDEENRRNNNKGFVKDRTTVKATQTSGNYHIEDTERQQQRDKPAKVKPLMKKPLAIKIKSKVHGERSKMNMDPELVQDDCQKDDVDVEVFRKGKLVPRTRFDQRSVYSSLNTDENKGKLLMMDMFLKSTQVFKGEQEDVIEETTPNSSKNTIEETNFLFQNNVQDRVKGINTTMSISVNVKKKRAKGVGGKASKGVQTSIDRLTSKCVQTSWQPDSDEAGYNGVQRETVDRELFSNAFMGDRIIDVVPYEGKPGLTRQKPQNLTSKCIQTSQIPEWCRQKSYQTDLADRLDGFTLQPNDTDDMNVDYTIVINTVHKKEQFRFVRKSEDMDVDESGEVMGFKPVRFCHCDEEEGKLFNFGGKNDFPLSSLFRERGKGEKPIECDRPDVFRKPINPATNKNLLIKQANAINKNNHTDVLPRNNLIFRGLTKFHKTRTENNPTCVESPYFSKKNTINNIQLDTNIIPQTFEKSKFEKFQPMFKSTQVPQHRFREVQNVDNMFKNILNDDRTTVASPFFTKNCPTNSVDNNFPTQHNFYTAVDNGNCFHGKCGCLQSIHKKENHNPYCNNQNFDRSPHPCCFRYPIVNKDQNDCYYAYKILNNHYENRNNDQVNGHLEHLYNRPKISKTLNFNKKFEEIRNIAQFTNVQRCADRGCSAICNNFHQNEPAFHLQPDNLHHYQHFHPSKCLKEQEVNYHFLNERIPQIEECLRPVSDPQMNHEMNIDKCQQNVSSRNRQSLSQMKKKSNFMPELHKDYLKTQNGDKNYPPVDVNDPPYFKPIVSDKDMYLRATNGDNLDIVDEIIDKQEDNMFNFKSSLSPNIFSSEALRMEEINNKALSTNVQRYGCSAMENCRSTYSNIHQNEAKSHLQPQQGYLEGNSKQVNEHIPQSKKVQSSCLRRVAGPQNSREHNVKRGQSNLLFRKGHIYHQSPLQMLNDHLDMQNDGTNHPPADVTVDKNLGIVDELIDKQEDNMFNFKSSLSPNIFTNEALRFEEIHNKEHSTNVQRYVMENCNSFRSNFHQDQAKFHLQPQEGYFENNLNHYQSKQVKEHIPQSQKVQSSCVRHVAGTQNSREPNVQRSQSNMLFRKGHIFHQSPAQMHNDRLDMQNIDSNNPPADISDPPIVSDKDLYFQATVDENLDIVDEKIEKPKDKMFNFNPIFSPNIFSSEALNIFDNNSKNVNKNIESNKKELESDKINYEELNTICNLADFGLERPKKATEVSNLQISLANGEEQRNFVEKQLLEIQDNNRRNNMGCDSEFVPNSLVQGQINSRNNVFNVENNTRRTDENDMEKQSGKSRIILDSQNEWLRQTNQDGKKFFVNKRTGMVTARTPKLTPIEFDFDERLDFVPKGMSPVLKEHKKIDKILSQNAKSKLHDLILEGYEDELLVIKWQNFIGDSPKSFFEEIYREKSKQFETCIPSIKESHLKMPKELVSFGNKMFRNLDVIGQVDNKFIAARDRNKNVLILFDQHAVHERIRVERFLKEYRGVKTPYKEKLTIFMPHNDLALLKKHSALVESLGLGVEFFTNGLHVTDIPLCIREKFNAEGNLPELNTVLNMLIKDTVEFLKLTRGSNANQMPKIIQNIINLKACRGAFKFGDTLTTEKCKNLLKYLSACKLPFQCAHGRPTLTPILSLSKVPPEVTVKKPNLKKLLQLKNY